ncbi:MAG: hypothetical protein KKH28_01835 [Elusimicrobia bacterium]|nr:hypothetical protein [Elusimicrobiota bacterium]
MFYEDVFRKLSEEKVRYLIIGGIAVNLYGFSRVTGDLDIMLDLDDNTSVLGFIKAVKELGFKPKVPVRIDDFADSSKRRNWVEEKNMKVFSVYNPANEIEHVDVMVENFIDFAGAYRTKEIIPAGGLKLPVVSIDALIKLKGIAGRRRDEIDIAALQEIKAIRNEKNKK